jgi:hypothetical protein
VRLTGLNPEMINIQKSISGVELKRERIQSSLKTGSVEKGVDHVVTLRDKR